MKEQAPRSQEKDLKQKGLKPLTFWEFLGALYLFTNSFSDKPATGKYLSFREYLGALGWRLSPKKK